MGLALFVFGGRGGNRTLGVSDVTVLQTAAFAARHTRPYLSLCVASRPHQVMRHQDRCDRGQW